MSSVILVFQGQGSQVTETEITAGCQQQDSTAQRELYALTGDRIYRLLLRMVRNAEDATDLAIGSGHNAPSR